MDKTVVLGFHWPGNMMPTSPLPPWNVPDDCAVVRDYAGAGDTLVVSFSGLKRNPAKPPGFSLRRTLHGLPVQKLFLRDLNRAWFLRGLKGQTRTVEETTEFLRRELAASGARKFLLTGYSLGGFAALLYGALLGADQVVAISPQTFLSFRLRLRHADHRWQRFIAPLWFGATRPYHDLAPWLARAAAHGEFHLHYARDSRLDIRHAEHVRNLQDVVIHEHAAGGHRLVSDLQESGRLRELFQAALAGETLRPARPGF